jgi:parallel beta-helix repeat protein
MQAQSKVAARSVGFALALLAIVPPAYAVDGVTEINQVRATAGGVTAGDTPGFPVTLSHPGSYRLTGNVSVSSADTTAIVISSGNVTLDLNGFAISCSTGVGPCAAGSGLGVDANQDNVTIINGTVRDMGSNGIGAGANARIEHVRALANHGNGISTAAGSTLTANTANGNSNDGLTAGISSTIAVNTLRDNGRGGMEVNSGCTVSGNTASDNKVFGIYCNGGCTIDRNTTNDNGTGISLLGGNTIIGNTAHNNTNFGIVAIGADSGYSLNTLTGNNGGGNAAQVSGGTPIGSNFCGTDTTCP